MVPGRDRMVEIPESDLLHLLICALSFNSRIPFGIPPERVWDVLSEEGRQWLTAQIPGEFPEPVIYFVIDRKQRKVTPFATLGEASVQVHTLQVLDPEGDYEIFTGM